MPDQVVILFMFAVITSFGIIWLANEMRLKFQARYLEYCFYFALVTVTYGFVNWIVPFIVLYVTHTVRNHIYNIYQKTGIKNRFQLLALFQKD